MRCSKCGAENPESKKFCGDCGAALTNHCPKCGAENPPGKHFCGDCGTALGTQPAAAETPSTSSPPQLADTTAIDSPEGERKTITALFADIKGSMELIEHLDPEQARNIIDPALKVMMEAMQRYGGHVVQSTGDGIFAVFGAPLAHEDHPQRALYAALRMQEELNGYSDRLAAEGRKHMQARVGINTGEAVVRSLKTGASHVEYTPVGHSIGLAARMQALAPSGSIAVTHQTKKLCDGYFNFKTLGTVRIKGVTEAVRVYEVTGLGLLRTHFQVSAERGLSKFVGRQSELEQLERSLELAKAGHGQIVAALGEAGVGKSRLFHEFKAVAQNECMLLETFSLAYGKASSHTPVVELLRSYFGIAPDDDKRVQREKRMAKLLAVDPGHVISRGRRQARETVTRRVLALDPRLKDTLPYMLALMGIQDSTDPLAQMDGQVKQRRTLEAIKRILLRESLNQPLLIIFEDLHWSNAETQALLDLLAESIATSRILLLVNYRPEFRHQWGNRSYYTQLRLDPLRAESAEEMLDALLGDGKGLVALRRLIVDKTEGNPFFMEELVQALFEQGALQRNGGLKLTESLAEIKVPATVQALLASRIDRLGPREKELLQTLAVMGREFAIGLIRHVADSSEVELDRSLNALRAGEYIYEQPAFPEVEYVFKHALTQEVAYNSVLIDRRKVLHQRAAEGIEKLSPEGIQEHLGELAYHYSRSDNDSRAVEYLVRAGQQALERSAFSQAGSYFEEALERLEHLPVSQQRDRKEIAIHTGLADVAIVTSGYASPEYERHLTRRHELAERLGDNTQIFYALVGISVLLAFRLELGKAREIGIKVVAIADQARDAQMLLEAHGSLANILWSMGDLRGVREQSEKGVELFALDDHLPSGKEHLRAACLMFASFCSAALGFPDQGLQRALKFLTWARKRGPLPLALALNCVATVSEWRREGAEGLRYSDALLALTAEHGFSQWHSLAQINRGQALALLGRADEAITEIESAFASYKATGATVPAWAYFCLAYAYLAAQRPGQGLEVTEKGLELAEKTGDRQALSELHRLRGELVLMSDSSATAEAEAAFRAAIIAAREQEAKFPELRATVSLARLLATAGKRDDARAMLADIYNWFTEGFDTADLIDAKALLDELSAV